MRQKVYCLCYEDDDNEVPSFFKPYKVFSSLEKAKEWVRKHVEAINNDPLLCHEEIKKYDEYPPYHGAVSVVTDGIYIYGIFEYELNEEAGNP